MVARAIGGDALERGAGDEPAERAQAAAIGHEAALGIELRQPPGQLAMHRIARAAVERQRLVEAERAPEVLR